MALTKAQQTARRKRLVVLADFLESVVAPRLDGAKFDMNTWGRTKDYSAVPNQIAKTSECGFAGCAIGWAYYCPPLVMAGIRQFIDNDEGWGLEVNNEDGLAAFFGISPGRWDFHEEKEKGEFNKCFMPASRSSNKGEKAVRRVAAVLRQVAAAPPEEVPTEDLGLGW